MENPDHTVLEFKVKVVVRDTTFPMPLEAYDVRDAVAECLDERSLVRVDVEQVAANGDVLDVA